MSYADKVFKQNVKDILENGVWDTDREVRPKWLDGTPAHTVKKFCIVNRYDLQKEFPIMTIRKQYLKSAIDEILWIWQKKSNKITLINNELSIIKELADKKEENIDGNNTGFINSDDLYNKLKLCADIALNDPRRVKIELEKIINKQL